MRQVRLPECCDVRNVSALHAQLTEALSTGEALELDATSVERCDTAAGQLFVAAARDPHVHWKLSPALRAQLTAFAFPLAHFRENPS